MDWGGFVFGECFEGDVVGCFESLVEFFNVFFYVGDGGKGFLVLGGINVGR